MGRKIVSEILFWNVYEFRYGVGVLGISDRWFWCTAECLKPDIIIIFRFKTRIIIVENVHAFKRFWWFRLIILNHLIQQSVWETWEIRIIFNEKDFSPKIIFLSIFSKLFSIMKYEGSIERMNKTWYTLQMIFDN